MKTLTQNVMIKSTVAPVGTLYVAFLLQTGLFARFALAGITPNLLLIVTALFGFFLGPKYGMMTGFFAGLMLDVYGGSYFGMYALIYTYIGLMNGLLSMVFYGDDIKLPVILVGGSDFVFGMIIYGSMFLLRGRNDTGFYVMNVMIPEAVYTTVVALFLYFPVRWLSNWIDRGGATGRIRT